MDEPDIELLIKEPRPELIHSGSPKLYLRSKKRLPQRVRRRLLARIVCKRRSHRARARNSE
jgi:hypothetical protein